MSREGREKRRAAARKAYWDRQDTNAAHNIVELRPLVPDPNPPRPLVPDPKPYAQPHILLSGFKCPFEHVLVTYFRTWKERAEHLKRVHGWTG